MNSVYTNMAKSELTITFFDNGRSVCREALKPIADVAEQRGYNVKFSEDMSQGSHVGVYNEHIHHIDEVNSDLSCVMFHGIDDEIKNAWSSWGRFDMGIVSGDIAAKNWKVRSWNPDIVPTYGIFPIGWPKSDRMFSERFNQKINGQKKELAIASDNVDTIIYAPSGHTTNVTQMGDFLNAAETVFEVLLIKQHPAVNKPVPDKLEEQVRQSNKIHVLDCEKDMMECLALADALVTDESSVLMEAPLTDTIPISVIDWPTGMGSDNWNRNKTLPDVAVETTRDNLSSTFNEVVSNYGKVHSQMTNWRSSYYNNLGESSMRVMDTIEAMLNSDKLPTEPTQAKQSTIKYKYHSLTESLTNSLSDTTKKRLKQVKLHKVKSRADEFFLK